MTNLNGSSVIITGASSGIGAATAHELVSHGCRVMLAARREDRLKKLANELRGAGSGEADYCVADTTDRAAVQRLAEQTRARFGQVDALFNNAGVMPLSPFPALHVEEWERMIDVNIKGVLYGIAAVLPEMLARGSGHIINNASVAGIKVFPLAGVYCATKHAVRALSEGLRMEVGPKVRVTIISPGAVRTELQQGSTHAEGVKRAEQTREYAIAPDAIARAVRFALEQPADVDVNEIVVRPTAQPL